MCLMTRQQAFWNVKCSTADTSKIQNPSDLWPLPWDKEDDLTPPITEEDQQELLALIADENARLAKESSGE